MDFFSLKPFFDEVVDGAARLSEPSLLRAYEVLAFDIPVKAVCKDAFEQFT